MDSTLDKDDILSKITKLTGRETAVALTMLRSQIPSIIINNDNNYLAKVIYGNDVEGVSDLLSNVQSVLISDKDIEWLKSNIRILIWFYNYMFAKGNGFLPTFCINNNSSFIDNLIAGFDCAFFQVMLSSPNHPFLSAHNFPVQYSVSQSYPIKTKYSHLTIDMNEVLNKPSHTMNNVEVNPTSFNDSTNKQQTQKNNSTSVETEAKTSIFTQFNFALESKSTFIITAKILYNLIHTKREYTSWIKTEDNNQLYWAWNYLDKAGILIKPQLFLAQNNEDLFAQICASLDAFDNNHNTSYPYAPSPNKKYFISNMRKAWSQKKFRDKTDIDAAQDLLLTRKAKKQLSELSSAYGINSVEMLTDIINTAHQTANI
ncbi:hypothetical protein [Psychrobacter vallis]|uniref:hypothetical protein n=1 Tax=Psychrobacter vallis TaxID=248451 RepID=UPI001919E13F|nr:hypothetical protein [Psychrobacter vallis]